MGAANIRGMHRPPRRPTHHRAHRPTRGLPALAGRRVRHRLTPTGPGRSRRTMAPKSPIGDAAPHPYRGAALPRPPRRWRGKICRGNCHRDHSARQRGHPAAPHVPALPDRPVRHRLTPTQRGGHPPVQACPGPGRRDATPVGARRCLARRANGVAIPRGRHVSHDTQRGSAERPSPRSPGRERPGSVPKPAKAGYHLAPQPGRAALAGPVPFRGLADSARG
jgi:hypothetical protein